MTRSLAIPDIDVARDLHRATVKVRLREAERVVGEEDISELQQHELEALHAMNKALAAVHSLGAALKACHGRTLDAEMP